MSTIEVGYVLGERVEVVSDGTWVPGVVDSVHVFRGGLVSYDVWSEADDKIVALLTSDTVFDYAKDIKHLPTAVVNRMIHYFATYKMDMTGGKPKTIEVVGTYGAEQARAVVDAAMADYDEEFGVADRRQS